MTPEQQLEKIKRGTVEIIQEKELLEKLRKKKKLIVKTGFDPTTPDIHLGHTVLLRKLRHFQECGHKVIFLIGDATALIGDPSGQTQTRPMLGEDEIRKNMLTYLEQVGKVLDAKDSKRFEVKRNSEWFGPDAKTGLPKIQFRILLSLMSKYTVARLLERDDFFKRYKARQPITILEFFYPLMQGYDSIELKADVELGGTDQKFNLLIGRELQRDFGFSDPQTVVTMPLLEGLDGVQKMSKSLGNYIGIQETPKAMFGKIMSISDEMMWKYYELLTDENLNEVKKLHPREAKKRLAENIVTQYHDNTAAKQAGEEFERSVKGIPKENPKYPFTSEMRTEDGLAYQLPMFLASSGMTLSRAEARRKIDEGALKINGNPWTEYQVPVDQLKIGDIFQIGKKSVEVSGTS